MGHRVSAILVSLMPRTSMICGVIMGVHGFGDSCSGLHWFEVWGISGTDEEGA